MTFAPDTVIAETRAWVDRAVIGLNLCPFARAVQVKNQIRYVVSGATDPDALLATLREELHLLAGAAPARVETTLLIHPCVLMSFLDFNDFLSTADAALEELGYARVLQVASFHPQYQFAGTAADDVTNATNRSPYPTLHLLREESIDRAVAVFPEARTIYERNIRTLQALGPQGWAALQAQCRSDAADAKDDD
ncbi:MAG TPA: DUF1415 domain-containing protein [Gemmatimonadales bacterium]|nr:DUF1415 domain-containing protein [Gemmatimonadales bacterium]